MAPKRTPKRPRSNHDQETGNTVSNRDKLNTLLRTNTESTSGHPLPKIQRVQPYLRESNPKYYSPKLVSIGPIHHGKDLLQQGEKYKYMWAVMYLKAICPCNCQQLYNEIEDNLLTLKGLYTKDVIKGHNDEDLKWIFFLDGCAVLYFMENASAESQQKLKIKVDQLLIVQQDLLLLENQLPFQVLKLLSNDDEPQLLRVMKEFFIRLSMIPEKVQGKENNTTSTHDSIECGEVKITVDQPTHLLHHLRNEIIGHKLRHKSKDEELQPTFRNIQELKASGIHVKKNKENAMRTDINFETHLFSGRLYLSKFIVDDSMAPTLLNMIAFEMCPDFENNYEISSYVVFLDSLIDIVDDVKELRKAGVLLNMLGSDEEVSKLFNTISTDLVVDEDIYREVREKIEGHYKSKYKTLIAQARYNYFSSPWAFYSLMGALMALFLTFVQTLFTVYPIVTKN